MSGAGRSLWPQALAEHTVFRMDGESHAGIGEKHQLLAVRGMELIVVVQNEIRFTSLAQAKRALSSGDDYEANALLYKVLTSEVLTFEIKGIMVNPTGKLLLVHGSSEVVILLLPRRSCLQSVGTDCGVKGMRVGSFFHAPKGCSPIAQCGWHPRGQDGASLIVLTADALLREYNVLRDLEEPQQTLECIPNAGRRHSAYFAGDEDAACAVAFEFGDTELVEQTANAAQASASWLLFTMFILTRSGDVWALCPFMPKSASLPRSIVNSLAQQQVPNEYARRYLADLANQMQLQKPTDADADMSFEQEDASGSYAATVAVNAPSSVPHRVEPQGPFLLQPAPIERSEDQAPIASSMFFTQIFEPDTPDYTLDVLGIGNRDGSVQLCILADRILPSWLTTRSLIPKADKPAPLLMVYESIMLPMSTLDSSCESTHEQNVLQFVRDPLYTNTVFVTHNYGVHRIIISWAETLLKATSTGNDAMIGALGTDFPHSQVTCIATTADTQHAMTQIVGSILLHDVYLSYTFLAITFDMQLVAVELELRAPTDGSQTTSAEMPIDPIYASLLDNEHFHVPQFSATLDTKQVSSEPIKVTASTLRSLGSTAEQVRTQMHSIVTGANVTQNRLDRQVGELKRQIEQLSGIHQRIQSLQSTSLTDRLQRIERGQQSTISRIDKLLQQLMDQHEPELSIHEKRWLEELQRMSREFGVNETKGASALEQLQKLQHQFQMLQPSFEQFSELQHQNRRSPQHLGTTQTQRIEELLGNEAQLIAQARAKILWMQQKLSSR
ncbi:hypothetical protein MPSI1_000433 [Malassezia psittaci]|uniref:Uncharacterized protein n=1 Tax=Malassezia psittaci TaxID=1821823 RepID=A0AAF0FBK8_9BASI|nr:hypothetical protein MPSI1_000433 [Malassezia psittaci]